MNKDLKWIKKHYSEKMMHLCRDYLSSMLEIPGLLPKLLSDNFHNNNTLADDIIKENKQVKFKDYLYLIYEGKEDITITDKDPFELMRQASYTLYKCNTVSDVESFVKYYKQNEVLCTFKDIKNRLEKFDVYFAVKDNVDNIKRSIKPDRQDLYGTSVISLQFSKGDINNVSIKNRYNHTVNNPDATFSNNLENIIEGLTYSFEKNNNYNIKNKTNKISFELKNYVMGPDNKFYKYNIEVFAGYYCPDNIYIRGNFIKQFERERYTLFDTYILDLKEKKLVKNDVYLDRDKTMEEIFSNVEYIKIEKINKLKHIIIKKYNETNVNIITINKDNTIKSVIFPSVHKVKNNFLKNCKNINYIELVNAEEIGGFFLSKNKELKELSLPKTKKISDYFLENNRKLSYIYLPSVETIGNFFLKENRKLKSIDFPNLKYIKIGFLNNNEIIDDIKMKSIKSVGFGFLNSNPKYKYVSNYDLSKLRNLKIYEKILNLKKYKNNI